MHNHTARLAAEQEWNRARRKSFLAQIAATIRGQSSTLVNFDEIAQRLKLRNYRYLGTQNIPTDQIVGSIGRYQDFMHGFLPKSNAMRHRWEAVAQQYLGDNGPGVPPIEVFKVGTSYFVRDGNHRVSVCKKLGISVVEAYVWEYRIEIEEACGQEELEALLLAAEKQDFYDQTHLRQLRPHADISVTLPGGYLDILQHIVHYQAALQKIDETEVSFAEAVENWYEMRYEPIISIIEAHQVMEKYPQRTVSDLYVFTTRELQKLKSNQNRPIRMTQAVQAVSSQSGNFIQRWWRKLRFWSSTAD